MGEAPRRADRRGCGGKGVASTPAESNVTTVIQIAMRVVRSHAVRNLGEDHNDECNLHIRGGRC